MPTTQITFSLAPDEYTESLGLRRRTALKADAAAAVVVVSFLVVTEIFDSKHFGTPKMYYALSLEILFGFVLVVIMSLFKRYFLWPRASRRLLGENPELYRDVSFSWNGDGFSQKTANVAVNFNWADLLGYAEGKHVFGLYVSNSSLIMVPKRAFDKEAHPAFASLLRQKLRVLT